MRTPVLKEDFTIDVKDYEKENGGVIFPNPNAPTGVYMPLDQVEEILKANQDVVVIVDEAYVDFAGPSALELLDKYENLLVVQTFSKSRSMAGMRIGYAFGNKDLIKALNDVKFSFNSYTMNAPTLAYGVAAVEDDAYFKECVEKIKNTREEAKKQLMALGFTFPDSTANFIFATHQRVPAKTIFEELKKRNIYVRYFNKPRIDQLFKNFHRNRCADAGTVCRIKRNRKCIGQREKERSKKWQSHLKTEIFQKELEKKLQELQQQDVKHLLLHSCCAPCSSYVIEYLSRYFRITVFYYNPNISAEEEYRKRVLEQQRFIKEFPAKYPVDFVEGDYEPRVFFDTVKGYEQCKEGGERCFCGYELRLKRRRSWRQKDMTILQPRLLSVR